jgi:hypothetical protein
MVVYPRRRLMQKHVLHIVLHYSCLLWCYLHCIETLILAEMILNNSSLQLINNGKHTDKCLDVVTEISKNSFLTPINTLPSLYQSRQDIMLITYMS